MDKASNQEDGVIARMGLFPSARWLPVHLCGVAAEMCLWGGSMLIMEKWLAEAFFFFLLRLLMAPSCHLKGSGKYLSRAQACLCLRLLPLSASVIKGPFQPQMFLLLPHTQDKLQN